MLTLCFILILSLLVCWLIVIFPFDLVPQNYYELEHDWLACLKINLTNRGGRGIADIEFDWHQSLGAKYVISCHCPNIVVVWFECPTSLFWGHFSSRLPIKLKIVWKYELISCTGGKYMQTLTSTFFHFLDFVILSWKNDSRNLGIGLCVKTRKYWTFKIAHCESTLWNWNLHDHQNHHRHHHHHRRQSQS